MKIRVEKQYRTDRGSAAHAADQLLQERQDAPKSVADVPPAELIAALTSEQSEQMCALMGLPKPVNPHSALGRAKALNRAVKTDPALRARASDALNLLANDDYNNLSGGALVKYLKISGGPVAATDPDSAALEEMRAALSQNRNSNIEADAGPLSRTKSSQAAGVWERAIAKVCPV